MFIIQVLFDQGDKSEEMLVYDFDGCIKNKEAIRVPYEDVTCGIIKKESDKTMYSQLLYVEQSPVYFGLKFNSKVKLELQNSEVEQLKSNAGTLHIEKPLAGYKPFSYQNSQVSLGYLIVTAVLHNDQNEVAIYYDNNLCRGDMFTKLPRVSENCDMSKNIHTTSLSIPNYGNEIHYIATQLNHDDEITFSYNLIPVETIQVNSAKLANFNESLFITYELHTNGSEEMTIKVLNTNPLNSCRIYVDYEGCQTTLDKLPRKDSHCEASHEALEDGYMCLIKVKAGGKDKVYFGVESKQKESIYVEVISAK
jgi:hypothetical protein